MNATDDTGQTPPQLSPIDAQLAPYTLVSINRMSNLSTLIGAVAHQLNNPLSFVTANVEFTLRQFAASTTADEISTLGDEKTPVIVDALRDALEGSHRLESLIAELGHTAPGEKISTDPAEFVELSVLSPLLGAVNMARKYVERRAILELDITDVPTVQGDAKLLHQLFSNLLLNAAQANCGPGTIEHRVRISTETADEGVSIIISDTGCGIAEESMNDVFSPFFSDGKPAHLGLGLYVSRLVVDAHGGAIEVESAPGEGTILSILLPTG